MLWFWAVKVAPLFQMLCFWHYCDTNFLVVPCQIPSLHVNHPIHGLPSSDNVQFSLRCIVIRSHCFNFVTILHSHPSHHLSTGLIKCRKRLGLQRTPTANELFLTEAAYRASRPGRKAGNTKTNTPCENISPLLTKFFLALANLFLSWDLASFIQKLNKIWQTTTTTAPTPSCV